MTDHPTTPAPPSKLRGPLNSLGVLILIVGLAIAAIIYPTGRARPAHRPTAPGEWQDSSLSTVDSKRSSRDVEMYSGKLGLLVVQFQDWTHQPASPAIIIATVSVLAASACFLAAKYRPGKPL